ncbi:hypothetical protein SAMN05192559_101710 [Halobacillus karajensis]|uniref:DUF6933 domain-containing protein n=1 Tax=Halobacillus karajensis TaxID=195088 RepID=A0A024P4C6_9BACI|nr:hypothetical protein [Halobacillus karajensis]CDQ18675.1 hypothetical protein BN982_00952 [Halobacillus karajensis]CDQ23253.1 hypothetical protein BN983_01476 [Halobacillus karajensis]CDQ26735.1 hypothetical protein BN981_00956 [Halobacillus karajensis]SEH48292.1 hypothetical protein SAMN05192559_101710 [Halobacillus karajensis]
MFVIGATKKLQNEINKPIENIEEYNEVPDIHQWHGNIVTLNRRKCLILMNNATGLNLTLLGLRKEQFEHLDSVIKGSLRQLFQLLDVEKGIADEMLAAADDIAYTKTNNRKILGMMNEIKFFTEDTVMGQAYEDIDAAEINNFNNKTLVFSGLDKQNPYDQFIAYFEKQ